ncbi:MAG TPA: YceD family protein [Candidatus Baltobacteraceae bacterium]|jgi:uncharacterized protein|nr:YceD family protein [Candidatus Baltobacteraceae bacterium]
MPVKVNIRHLEERDIRLKGQLPAAELELGDCDELVHASRPLHYDLTAQRTGSDIVAQGSLELTLDCECARCLKAFTYVVRLDPWTVHVPLEGPEKVAICDDLADLTPQIREDILLEFPQHPLCGADCAGLPNRSKEKKKGAGQTDVSSAWSELNKLKF